jgi:HK97 family phage prohead protease
MERDAWGAYVKEHRPKVCADAPPLRKYMTVEVKDAGTNPETGMKRFDFVASTDAVDREGDILFPDGWELDNYHENPVILWAHESWTYPIGRSVATKLDNGQLRTTIEFTPADVNPEGHRVYKLVEAGFVKAVSVGFQPKEWVWNDDHKGYDFTRNELLEISVVPVPANQEALLAAGVDASTAKWYSGISKGAAAQVVLDQIIKTAVDYNTNATPDYVLTGGGSHTVETTPQCMFVSCDIGAGDSTGITYTDSGGNTWDGTLWTDKECTVPYAGGEYDQVVLPSDFVWPPAPTKELDMKELEALEKTLDGVAAAVAALPGAIKDALSEALAEAQPETDPDPEVDPAAEPVADPDPDPEPAAVADPAGDPAGDADPEPEADTAEEDDTILEVEGLTEDGLRGMVVDALAEARTATTGKLPD